MTSESDIDTVTAHVEEYLHYLRDNSPKQHAIGRLLDTKAEQFIGILAETDMAGFKLNRDGVLAAYDLWAEQVSLNAQAAEEAEPSDFDPRDYDLPDDND